MKKIGILISGLVLGIILSFIGIYMAAPSLMVIENQSKYNFEETTKRLEDEVKANNWKITKVHDLQASMSKFNLDVDAVKVYELCKPEHAGKILSDSESRKVSSLMPCRVAVYEKDGQVILSRMNSGLMAKTFGGLIAAVMADASKENEEILKNIIQR